MGATHFSGPVHSDGGYQISGTGAVQFTQTSASGYSFNLVDVTSAGSGANLRGWRVNVTSAASATVGDTQCIHGYLTLGATPTISASAAVYPLSAWLDLPDTTTFSGAAVVAGCRVIVDPNNNAIGSAAAGVESAIFYGQTWASTGTIDSGLFLAAGAGSTIDSAIELGSGTFGRVIDLTSWGADTVLPLVVGGPKDATGLAHWGFFVGDATDHASIVAEVGGTSYGSLYASTAGKLWVNESGTWTAQT